MQCSAKIDDTQCPNQQSEASWNRWATPEEVTYYHETGDLPLGENTARIAQYPCSEHNILLDLKAGIHPSDCTWPSSGVCGCVDPDLTYEGIPPGTE